MTLPSVEQFVGDAVPARCGLASALLEHAALRRGLEVRRFNRQIVLVRLGAAVVPFHGVNGPDTSETAQLMRTHRDTLYTLLTARGVPVPRWSVFTTEQRKPALSYARGLGWPVTVRPARASGDDGATADVTGATAFRDAWQASIEATRTGSSHTTAADAVLVREEIGGRRMQVFVVAGNVAAVTELVGVPPGQTRVFRHGSTTPAHGRLVNLAPPHQTAEDTARDGDAAAVRAVAVAAVQALPGMAYGTVDVIAPEPVRAGAAAGSPVVTYVDCSAVPVAQFPTDGEPCDVAGAILDHYLDSPRWASARATPHKTGTAGTERVEPLYLGRA
ncbi:hypothetical protein G1H11_02075 [Phytoactinopolyspora alkaliphila]|uniref:ATP-grasp domain-containing protein n=1 Tax=Phytoactinopolyspora alkaliphila TaxID=1783498 RepID=A0A6N9YGA9_9ACTN|nr:hypothetical protein [Phytoactinopolyspora alkaliphila]NED94091.1 hypothetical protein [Phytoactinopolyspora alkaliphila]